MEANSEHKPLLRRKKQTSATTLRPVPQEIHLPFRLPSSVAAYKDEHKKWLQLLNSAEKLTNEDISMQARCAKGLAIPTRSLPPEIIGRFYAQYCELINKMYESYLKNMQLQRSEYLIEIISILIKRMYELREELVFVIVNDYIYVDTALQQLFKTPFDIQIVVPYHFAKEMREDTMEALIQKMWRDAKIRKMKKERQLAKPKKVVQLSDPELAALSRNMDEEEVEEEEEFNIVEEVSSIPDERLNNVLLIQRHERFRQFYLEDHEKKCSEKYKFLIPTVQPAPRKVKAKAARLIQKVYRYFMNLKRKQFVDNKRDKVLGLIPDFNYTPVYKYNVEAEKLYEKRRLKRKAIVKEHFSKATERQQTRLLWMRKEQQIEDITGEIIEWFREWYTGYGFFPQYPYPLEQGTIVVLRGDYPTIEEQAESDEKWNKENKNITAEQKKKNAEQKKLDAIMKLEAMKEAKKKQDEALFKARCNPQSDPGYQMKTSMANDDIRKALIRYRQAWSLSDKLPPESTVERIYGYMIPLLTESLMEKMYKECREYVDILMRIELKLFIKAQKELYKSIAKPWPKMQVRPRPKKPTKVPIPLILDDELLAKFEPVFDLEIMSKSTTKLDDIIGDFSYTNYDKYIIDPFPQFASPAYGDVKRRLVLSCAFASGVEPSAPRNKAVMLLGIPRNGKSFLVDAIAGELNAVKFDISPHVLSTRTRTPAKMLTQIFMAARIFGPSIIFLKNIEKVFYKKVPPAEKHEKAKSLKSPLTKLLKALPLTDKVIFIATCSNPWAAKIGPMMNMFNEKIYVPAPDYNSVQKFFSDKLLKQISTPRNLSVQPLARVFQGIGFGLLIEMFERIMCPDRIVKLMERPLQFHEFMEYMIVNQIEPLTDQEFAAWMKLCVQYSPYKKVRAEYAEINAKRAEAYVKLAKAEESKKNM